MLQNSSNSTDNLPEVPKPKRWRWVNLAWLFWLPVWVFAAFMSAQLLTLALIELLQGLGVSFEDINSAIFSTTVAAVSYVLAITIVIGLPWLVFKRETSLKVLGLSRLPNWKDLASSPVTFIIYILSSGLFVALIASLVPSLDLEQAQDVGFESLGLPIEYILAFITLVVIAPVAEELLFRGYLLGKLGTFLPSWAAILVSSALFGLLHGQWNVILDTFILGIFLGMLRKFTGSIWAPILLHMIKNGLAYYLLFVNPSLISTLGG